MEVSPSLVTSNHDNISETQTSQEEAGQSSPSRFIAGSPFSQDVIEVVEIVQRQFLGQQSPWDRYEEIMGELSKHIIERAFLLADENGDGKLNDEELLDFILLVLAVGGEANSESSNLQILLLLMLLLESLKSEYELEKLLLFAAAGGESDVLESLLGFLNLVLGSGQSSDSSETEHSLLAFLTPLFSGSVGDEGKSLTLLLQDIKKHVDQGEGEKYSIDGLHEFLTNFLKEQFPEGDISFDNILSVNIINELKHFLKIEVDLKDWPAPEQVSGSNHSNLSKGFIEQGSV